MSEKRFNAELAHKLDDPARGEWLPLVEILGAIGVQAGATVIDVGAGTGYFTLPLAEAVGGEGHVYALDAQEEMLAIVRGKLEGRGAGGAGKVELVHAEADQTGLPDGSCDVMFAANVWHEFADRGAVLREAARILRGPAHLAILDWKPDAEPEHGPPVGHRVTAESAVEELKAAGFEFVSQQDIGKYSWLVQARAMPVAAKYEAV